MKHYSKDDLNQMNFETLNDVITQYKTKLAFMDTSALDFIETFKMYEYALSLINDYDLEFN